MKESIELDTDPRARRRPAKGQKPAQVPLRPAPVRTRERSGEDRAVRVTPIITRGPPTTTITLSPRSVPPAALKPHVATAVAPTSISPVLPVPPPFPPPAVAPGVVVATPSPVAQTVPPAAPIATLSPSAGGVPMAPFEPTANAEDSITITPVSSEPKPKKGAGVLIGVGGGAAVGFFAAGPVGAVVGGALGYFLGK